MSGRAPLAPVPGLARTAGIPPPPPRPAAAAANQSMAAGQPVTPPTEEPVPRARPAKSATSSRASDMADTMRSVTLSLPVGVVRQVKDRARAERVSQPEVVMDALIATRDQLDDLLAEKRRPAASDGLFLRRTSGRGSADPLATLSLRMLTRNVDAIDDLVNTHQAPSRSALCLVALKTYLGRAT